MSKYALRALGEWFVMSPKPPGEPRLPIFVDVAYHLVEVVIVVRDCNEIVVPDEKKTVIASSSLGALLLPLAGL